MQISGHMNNDGTNLLSEEKWVYAPTELGRAERVRRALAAYDLSPTVDVPFILSVLDRAGLFHEPIPAPKTIGKTIRRAARAAARWLRRCIERIRAGRALPENDRERQLAADWPRLGPVTLQMEEEKIRCATYQTSRGGRIVPVGPHANRRPERELTHALLLIECHLGQTKKDWSHAQDIACLTDIVRVLEDLQDDVNLVAARVRERLREARKDESLQIWKHEYLDALSAVVVTEEMQAMRQRQQQFYEMMAIFVSPDVPESVKEEAAARLGPLFRVS